MRIFSSQLIKDESSIPHAINKAWRQFMSFSLENKRTNGIENLFKI